MRPEIADDVKDWVGDGLDLASEFDSIDSTNRGKITFEELVNWAMKKNLKIELKKEEDRKAKELKEGGEDDENEEATNDEE